ncbi:MAG TPA: hypothetical protein VF669_01475 [Tepidisphaeraceae bacterium]
MCVAVAGLDWEFDMQRSRIGELLSRIVPLSNHDVEEILQEQSGTHRRFGEIALAWGLCQPEHVWNAWCRQLAQGVERVDLDQVGIDTQAAGLLSADVARELEVLPLRVAGDVVVVATSDDETSGFEARLANLLHHRVMFVRADGEQLRNMIDRYYPLATV